MVHSAFRMEPIAESMEAGISSLCAWKDNMLLVGTKDGRVLLLAEKANSVIPEYETKAEISPTGGKAVQSICVCSDPPLAVVLGASDGISVLSLPSLEVRAVLLRTKGAHAMGVQDGTGTPTLAVALKKSLLFMPWDVIGFSEGKEVAMSEEISTVVWAGDHNVLFAGGAKSYYIVEVGTGSARPLFGKGSCHNPVLLSLPATEEVLLVRNDVAIFQHSRSGRPTRKYGLVIGDSPFQLVWTFPFVVALLPRGIEVCLPGQKSAVQSLSARATCLASSPGLGSPSSVIAVVNNALYRLQPVPVKQQIQELTSTGRLEEAVSLARAAPSADGVDLAGLERKLAYLHFRAREFKAAFELFQASSTPEQEVISLFPALCPDYSLPSATSQPTASPIEPSDEQYIEVIQDLVKFLMHRRNLHYPSQGDKFLDTALVRAYLVCDTSQISKFLTSPNSADLVVCERLLLQARLDDALISLFKSQKAHAKALQLLKDRGSSANETGPLRGTTATIDYLRHLDASFEGLILDYSRWPLAEDPKHALTIFTDPVRDAHDSTHGNQQEQDTPGAAKLYLSVSVVLEHLKSFDSPVSAGNPHCLRGVFLERILARNANRELWPSSEMEEAVEKLTFIYIEMILKFKMLLRKAKKANDAESEQVLAEAHAQTTTKLRKLLESVPKGKAEGVLRKLPMDDLFFERAVLLKALKKHKEALEVLIHSLKDVEQAEQYCANVYKPPPAPESSIYSWLVSVCVTPARGLRPNVSTGMQLLKKHCSHIEMTEMIEVLPPSTPLKLLLPFLQQGMRSAAERAKRLAIERNLHKAQNLETQVEFQLAKGACVSIGMNRVCSFCRKRIGDSVFVWLPGAIIVHYGCFSQHQQQEEASQ